MTNNFAAELMIADMRSVTRFRGGGGYETEHKDLFRYPKFEEVLVQRVNVGTDLLEKSVILCKNCT